MGAELARLQQQLVRAQTAEATHDMQFQHLAERAQLALASEAAQSKAQMQQWELCTRELATQKAVQVGALTQRHQGAEQQVMEIQRSLA